MKLDELERLKKGSEYACRIKNLKEEIEDINDIKFDKKLHYKFCLSKANRPTIYFNEVDELDILDYCIAVKERELHYWEQEFDKL